MSWRSPLWHVPGGAGLRTALDGPKATVVVPDGPRPDEVVDALVMTTGPRAHHRIGGLTIDGVIGDDGLRQARMWPDRRRSGHNVQGARDMPGPAP